MGRFAVDEIVCAIREKKKLQVKAMEDLIWVAVTIAFFAISVGYVHFCDRVK
jgi:hypothetical protein